MKTFLLACLFLFVSVDPAFGQQPSADANSHILPDQAKSIMSRLVGTWTTTGESDGKPFTGLYQARWNDSQTGLIYTSREGHGLSNGLGYWDSATNELVEVWTAHDMTVVLRYNEFSNKQWSGKSTQMVDDSTIEGAIRLDFGDGSFSFRAEVNGKTTYSISNQRVSIKNAKRALDSYAKVIVGGTWTTTNVQPRWENTYSWLPGNKVLKLERSGGEFPGISLIAIDHRTQSVVWHEIDDDGVVGSAVMVQTGAKQWKLFGHYTGENEVQDIELTVTQLGPDELKASGSLVVNGKREDWKAQHWTRSKK